MRPATRQRTSGSRRAASASARQRMTAPPPVHVTVSPPWTSPPPRPLSPVPMVLSWRRSLAQHGGGPAPPSPLSPPASADILVAAAAALAAIPPPPRPRCLRRRRRQTPRQCPGNARRPTRRGCAVCRRWRRRTHGGSPLRGLRRPQSQPLPPTPLSPPPPLRRPHPPLRETRLPPLCGITTRSSA